MIKIARDTLDGSNWIRVDVEHLENELDHDQITQLELIKHKHNLSGGNSMITTSHETSYGFVDQMSVWIKDPTPEFEKELAVWLFKNS